MTGVGVEKDPPSQGTGDLGMVGRSGSVRNGTTFLVEGPVWVDTCAEVGTVRDVGGVLPSEIPDRGRIPERPPYRK